MDGAKMAGIALRLKEHTRSAHQSAEGQNFQVALGGGTLSLTLYKAYLFQLFLIHAELESQIREHSVMINVVTDEQMQTSWLRQDLLCLKVDLAAGSPTEATRQILEKIRSTAKTNAIALLGYHYVLLGSKHGGKYIAAMIKKNHNLENGGTKYFDPYGPEFQKHWQRFIGALNELELTDAESKAMVEAAGDMFSSIEQIGSELESSLAVQES